MKVSEFQKLSNWSLMASDKAKEREISGVFCGDLLSWVMGNAMSNQLWITVQTHLNTVAVAALKELSAIVIVQGVKFPQESIDKAMEEDIAVFEVDCSAYEACCEAYRLGLK